MTCPNCKNDRDLELLDERDKLILYLCPVCSKKFIYDSEKEFKNLISNIIKEYNEPNKK